MTRHITVAVLIICGLWLVGCSGSESHSSESSQPPEDRPGVEPGTPTWFHSNDFEIDLEAPPEEVPLGEVLLTQVIAPSEVSQTIEAPGGVKVTLPPGAVAESVELIIAEAGLEPELPPTAERVLRAVDIRLGDQHVFNEPLIIEVPFAPADLPVDVSAQKTVAAMYWHPRARAWVSVPVQVDADAGVMRVATRHLTLYAFVVRPANLLLYHDVHTAHFSIYYDADALQAEHDTKDETWSHLLSVEGDRDQTGMAQQTGPDTVTVEGQEGVPMYILYLARALEYEYAKYRMANLAVPTWTRTDIFVGVKSWGVDTSRRGKLTGDIYLAFSVEFLPINVRTTTAHEFFHEVQAGHLGLGVMSMNYRAWWLEATAEYAPRFVWGDAAGMKAMKPDYLGLPLETQDDTHEYSAAHFVKFLVEKRGIGFGALVRGTLDVPSSILSMEEASGPTYAGLGVVLQSKETFQDYGTSTTLNALDRVLRGSGTDLADEVKAFVAYLLFDGDCKTLVDSGDTLWELADNFKVGSRLAIGPYVTDESIGLTVKKNYATGIWAIRAEPFESGEDATRSLRVTLTNTAPTLVSIDVYVVKDGQRPAGGLKPVGSLGVDAARMSVPVTLGRKDTIYVVCVNAGGQEAQVPLAIRDGLEMEITPRNFYGATNGHQETLTVKVKNIPFDAPEKLRLTWTWPDGREFQEEYARPSDGEITDERPYVFYKDGEIEAVLADAATGKVLAEDTVEIKFEGSPPSMALEGERIIVTAGAPFELSARVYDAPANVEYRWFFQGATPSYIKTATPSAQFTVEMASEYDVTVSMYEAGTDNYLAGDKAVIEARAGEDLIWNRTYTTGPDPVLIEEHQQRRDGTMHGIYRKFYDGQAIAYESEYKDNQEMWFKHYYKNGVVSSEGQFDDNHKRTGMWATYAENGAKKEVTTWSENDKHGPYEKYFGDTGLPDTIGRYSQGLPDGEWRAYYPPGEDGKQVLKVEYGVSKNILNGPRKEYNRQGVLVKETPYTNNTKDGIVRQWDSNGVKSMEEEYANDVFVVRRYYNAAGEVTKEERP